MTIKEKVRSVVSVCVGRLLDRAYERGLLDDSMLFEGMVNHAVDKGKPLEASLGRILDSDRIFHKILSSISDTEVGTTNQARREEWLQGVLLKVPAGSRLLDAGAGELQYKRFCSHLDYVSQDFAKYDGVGDGSGLQTQLWAQSNLDIVSDITEIPEPDSTFDAIMCIEVLEHIPDPLLAIREFSRLLRSGGQLILTAPFCSLTHLAPYHMATGFNRYFYHHHLPSLGFQLREVTPNGNYFEYLAQEIRRIQYVGELYAKDSPTRKELLCLKMVTAMLGRFSEKNHRSEELLSFGYFVIAEKV